MKISYDRKSDRLRISLSTPIGGRSGRTQRTDVTSYLHVYTRDEQVLSIVVEDASQHIDDVEEVTTRVFCDGEPPLKIEIPVDSDDEDDTEGGILERVLV